MKNKPIYTSIIKGKHKGKKLLLPSLNSTRSTKAILKESYFNTIQFDIMDASFVEVFGGSGSMGLEAISRGAKDAYFIELDKSAFTVLTQNVNSLEEENCTLYQGDSFVRIYDVLVDLPKEPTNNTFFYIDPPFSIREGMEDIYKKTVDLIADIPEHFVALIAVEHDSTIKFEETIGVYTKKKTKKFGKSSLTYYTLTQK